MFARHLGHALTRPSLTHQFLALLYEPRLLPLAIRRVLRSRRESKRKDERARQISVTIGSLDWIISQRLPYVCDPLLTHWATVSKKRDPEVARARPTAISLCPRQEKHTMRKLGFSIGNSS